jgi:LysR family transcriptional regulator, glycine cleavage system transcriptional activator
MRVLNRLHLNGLRAVEAVGRLGGLKAAADELGVTPGAVSQQIQKVESQLGRPLFARGARGLVPTSLGAEVMVHLSAGFSELARGVERGLERGPKALVVSVAPVFASKWLVWRLKAFNDTHPDLRVRMDATTTIIDPNTSDVDLCIRVFFGTPPGRNVSKLLEQRIFPVCSPAIAETIRTPKDLRGVPVIRDSLSRFGWDLWLDRLGLAESDLTDGPSFSDAALCLDAAIAGQGIFLAWETLANDAMARGQVIAPFDGRLKTGAAYWLVAKEHSDKAGDVAKFSDWLRAELGRYFEMTEY